MLNRNLEDYRKRRHEAYWNSTRQSFQDCDFNEKFINTSSCHVPENTGKLELTQPTHFNMPNIIEENQSNKSNTIDDSIVAKLLHDELNSDISSKVVDDVDPETAEVIAHLLQEDLDNLNKEQEGRSPDMAFSEQLLPSSFDSL